MPCRATVLLFMFALLPAMAQQEEPAVAFTSWEIPWEKTRPRDPAVDTDGIVWFAGQGGHYVGRLDPHTGELRKFDLPDGAGPHNVIVGHSGDIWVAGNKQAWIGRLDPATGELEKFFTASLEIDDPHTLVQESGPAIWFTAQWSNTVGRLDPRNGKIQQWTMPIERSRPYGIVLDQNDMPWIVLLGSNHLVHVDGGELEVIQIPREDARPRRLAMMDGKVWYVDYAQGYLGRFDPATNAFAEWRSPSAGEARPYGMTADDDGRIWYVETGPQPNRWIGFDTRAERFIVNQVIPDSGGAVRHMFFDTRTNSAWFGMDSNFIGRAELPPPRQ